ncbi:hypothetical protein I549_3357 [Mycobacterium avium subsp. avium 2285 (R)]|nr:hypothetical protein I549_3357 [Mycobacterium avium subsp. avium 2285 (R)]
MESGAQVGADEVVEFVGGDVQDRRARGFGDAGAVDQGVQPPERANALVDEASGDALVVGGSHHRGGPPPAAVIAATVSRTACGSRPLTTTPAPRPASSSATARPMPRLPPDTTAPRPDSNAAAPLTAATAQRRLAGEVKPCARTVFAIGCRRAARQGCRTLAEQYPAVAKMRTGAPGQPDGRAPTLPPGVRPRRNPERIRPADTGVKRVTAGRRDPTPGCDAVCSRPIRTTRSTGDAAAGPSPSLAGPALIHVGNC